MQENTGKTEKILMQINNTVLCKTSPHLSNWIRTNLPGKMPEIMGNMVKNLENNKSIYLDLDYLDCVKTLHKAGAYYINCYKHPKHQYGTYYWITINPDPKHCLNATFNDMYELLNIFEKFKYIKNIEYVVEQRAEYPRKMHGLHCHILLEKTVKKSKVISDIIRVFKEYKLTKNSIHFYICNTDKIVEDKRGYLRGHKGIYHIMMDKEEEIVYMAKKAKMCNDALLRNKEGILRAIQGNWGGYETCQ